MEAFDDRKHKRIQNFILNGELFTEIQNILTLSNAELQNYLDIIEFSPDQWNKSYKKLIKKYEKLAQKQSNADQLCSQILWILEKIAVNPDLYNHKDLIDISMEIVSMENQANLQQQIMRLFPNYQLVIEDNQRKLTIQTQDSIDIYENQSRQIEWIYFLRSQDDVLYWYNMQTGYIRIQKIPYLLVGVKTVSVQFKDQQIFICGGRNPCCSGIIDKNWIFHQLSDLIQPRYAQAICECKGYIYVFGGFFEGNLLKSAEIYDMQQNKWYELAQMNSPRAYFTAVKWKDSILLGGGLCDSEDNSIYSFNVFT